MKIQQWHYLGGAWKENACTTGFDRSKCQLVLAFGESSLITDEKILQHLRLAFPAAEIIFSSTSGEIVHDAVHDNSVVATAIQFEKTQIVCREINVKDHTNSHASGKYLMGQLKADDLTALFIISDGTHINGSELVAGLNEDNHRGIPITGGLAGDGARFLKTYTGLNKLPEEGRVVAVGFYGAQLKVGHGSFGGWDEFGPVRTITCSRKNVLYEIDGKSALDLYKEYLGPYKEELPSSALLFPLSIKSAEHEKLLVRTILSINEEDKSMTFAGNMPEGSQVRLMKANFDKLIDASSTAAKYTFDRFDENPDLAILISCVGRKLILQERTDEEVQAAKEIFGVKTCTTGFYSYGEISPLNPGTRCELHNQTMTITTLTEV